MSGAHRERKEIKPTAGGASPLAAGNDIITRRLRLRPLRERDRVALARLSETDAARQNLTIALLSVDTCPRTTFVLEKRTDRSLIGAGGYRPMAAREAAVEFAVCVAESEWGAGFGTEAAHAIIDIAFADAAVCEVWSAIRVTNNRARRVYEKCGFQPRGTGMARASAGAFPVEHVVLSRHAWASLKAWGGGDGRQSAA